jgi:ubiquinone/menaquinone biosynthesis C-methylase UbiE
MWAIITKPGTEGGKWDREAFFQTGVKEIRRVTRYLTERGYKLGGHHALDFGCGIGRLTQALAPHFDRVSGVDISENMVLQARAENPFGAKLRFYLNEVNDLQLFEGGTFDFIYSNITLQHMEPPYAHAYIREFIRVLQPGGLLLFQIPAALTSGEKERPLQRQLHRLRKALQPVLKPVAKLYHRIRWAMRRSPAMEMYGTPREEVESLIRASGAQLLDVSPNQNAGVRWESYYYLVTKEHN